MIYRFKIRFEDEEGFLSVVEVSTKHSFYHLHDVMQTAIGFNKKQDAAIYTSNDNWKPIKEFNIPANYQELIKQGEKLPLISSHIFDPYQKFLYVADKENEWLLEVELLKIADDEKDKAYPNVVRTEGFAPRQFVAQPILDDEESNTDQSPEPNAVPTEPAHHDEIEMNLEDFPDLGDIDELDLSEDS